MEEETEGVMTNLVQQRSKVRREACHPQCPTTEETETTRGWAGSILNSCCPIPNEEEPKNRRITIRKKESDEVV